MYGASVLLEKGVPTILQRGFCRNDESNARPAIADLTVLNALLGASSAVFTPNMIWAFRGHCDRERRESDYCALAQLASFPGTFSSHRNPGQNRNLHMCRGTRSPLPRLLLKQRKLANIGLGPQRYNRTHGTAHPWALEKRIATGSCDFGRGAGGLGAYVFTGAGGGRASSAAERSGESAHDHSNVQLRFPEKSLLRGKADVKDVHQAVRRVRRFGSEVQVVFDSGAGRRTRVRERHQGTESDADISAGYAFNCSDGAECGWSGVGCECREDRSESEIEDCGLKFSGKITEKPNSSSGIGTDRCSGAC